MSGVYTGNSENNRMQSVVNARAKLTGDKECFLDLFFLYSHLVVF